MSSGPSSQPCVPVLVYRYRKGSQDSWTALVPGGDPVTGINDIDLDQQVRSHIQASALAPGEFTVEYRNVSASDEGLRAALNDALERLEQSRAQAAAMTPPPPFEPGQRFLSGSDDAQRAQAAKLCDEQTVVALTEEIARRSAP
jgi:hypothetical protein